MSLIQLKNEGPPTAETVFLKGKHRWRKFVDVFFEYPHYIDWARVRPDGATGELREFLDWTDHFIEEMLSFSSRRDVSQPEYVDIWKGWRLCSGAYTCIGCLYPL
jgi:hypothetical protein